MDDSIKTARVRMFTLLGLENEPTRSAPPDVGAIAETFSQIMKDLEADNAALRQQNALLAAARDKANGEYQHYQDLFEYAPDAYIVTDAHGRIREANRAAVSLLNQPRGQLTGKPLLRFFHTSDREKLQPFLIGGETSADIEARILPKHRPPIDVSTTVATHHAAWGAPTQVCWTLRDITAQKNALSALDASERRFRTIYLGASMGILLADETGQLLSANPALIRMLGRSEENLTGRLLSEFCDPRDAGSLEHAIAALRSQPDAGARLDVRCLRPDGQIAWASISLSLMQHAPGTERCILAMVEDITSEKAAAAEIVEMRRGRLESAENERLRLAQELHDGPMQDLYGTVFRISTMTNEVKETVAVDDLHEVQDAIKAAAAALRNICGELRPPTLTNLGVERVIRSHAEKVQESHPELQVILHLSNDGQTLDRQTRTALFRIYQQCMANVLHHAQATRVVVAFHVSDTQAELDVWDNGKGFTLPESWIEFMRKGRYGLGGIAERIDALDGEMKIDTRPGSGTLVHVTVPK